MTPPLLIALIIVLSPSRPDVRVFNVSHYTNACVPANNGLTASGMITHAGVAACGPAFAFGALVLLEDGRLLICLDRGGAITDRHLDVWVPLDADGSETTAIRMGRKQMLGVVIP